jgi:hypothetical protein
MAPYLRAKDFMASAETRFGRCRAPEPVEVLSDNGSPSD